MKEYNNFYGEDVAYVHDTGFSNFANNAAEMITESLHNHGIDQGLVVDLGSGCGVIAKSLSESGYEVLGIEYSAACIARAQKKAPRAAFVQASFFDAEIPPCAAVTSTSECFNYLPGTKGTEAAKKHQAALGELFHRVFNALTPGGLFIFDMLEPRNNAPRDKKSIIEAHDWTMFIHTYEDAAVEQLTREVTLFRSIDTLYRKTKEQHHAQLYNQTQIIEMLQRSGFDVALFNRYDNITLDESHAGFLCRKPTLVKQL